MKKHFLETERVSVRRSAVSVSSKLHAIALARGAGNKLPTMDELCATLGTSLATLDSALSDLEARHVVLRKRGSGIYVSPRVSHKSIAIMFSTIADGYGVMSPFWGILQDVLWRSALERGPRKEHDYSYHLIPWGISPENSDVRKNFEALLLSGNLDGILCIRPDSALQDLMETLGIPTVGYAGTARGRGWAVGFDKVQMFKLAAEQLVNQGCRRIMLIAGHDVAFETYLEIVEIGRAMEPAMEFFPEKINNHDLYRQADHQDFGYRAAVEMFESGDSPRPDGLIVMEDMIADGMLKALFSMNVVPGRDIRIATHGNTASPTLRGWEKLLTIIEVDHVKLVDSMFGILDSIVAEESERCGLIHLPWNVRVHGEYLPAA